MPLKVFEINGFLFKKVNAMLPVIMFNTIQKIGEVQLITSWTRNSSMKPRTGSTPLKAIMFPTYIFMF